VVAQFWICCIDPILTKAVFPDPLHIGTGLDPDPVFFLLAMAFKYIQKIFFPRFFCSFLNVGTLTAVFKDNMSLRSQKTVKIMVNLNFFSCLLFFFSWKDPEHLIQ
jgi:hypothetical protein